MMESIYIVGIIALLLIMLVFILRSRITSFLAKGKVTRGKTSAEGEVRMGAAHPSVDSRSSKINPNSVDITGNLIIFGENILNLLRSGIKFAKNKTLFGTMKVTIKNQPNSEELPRHLPESEDE